MKSNCLFEAIKAKLKDPKNVKIVPMNKKIARGRVTHFMWHNIKDNTYSHFVWATENHNSLWYEGKSVTISEKDFQRYIVEHGIRLYRNDNKGLLKFLKKQNILFINIPAADDIWNKIIIWEDEESSQKPRKEEYDYLTDFFGKELPIKVVTTDNKLKYITFDELLKMPEGTNYKYITPFDAEFRISRIWEPSQWLEVFAGE